MGTENYLQWIAEETHTAWWNDSADPDELEAAIRNGAVGVTTNPVLCAAALAGNRTFWEPKIHETVRKAHAISGDNSSEASDKAENLVKTVVSACAEKVHPFFEGTDGKRGYVCAQVNPSLAGDREAMLTTAKKYAAAAPNISVKLPATAAGLDVLEECAAAGISVTGTVSFTLPQMLAIAERHEAGRNRALESGITPGDCASVIMIGRIDDYLRDVAHDNAVKIAAADDIRCAGLAIVKRAYRIFQEKQYHAKICIAAMRGAYHITETAGADLILSIHPKYQKLLLGNEYSREEHIDDGIDTRIIDRLRKIPEFSRAYEPDGMEPNEFIRFGATQRTLSQFIESGWKKLESMD